MEIALLVKKYFPLLKIIEPIEWQNRFKGEIKQYFENEKKCQKIYLNYQSK